MTPKDEVRRRAGLGRVRELPGKFRSILWEAEDEGFVVSAFRIVSLSAWKFKVDRGFLRASALTYTSLLSLVPLMALTFSVLKGLGVQRRLEPIVLERLALGNEEIVSRVMEYVDNTKIGALGAVGLVTLLMTAVSVLGNIELSFNDIWQVRKGRTLIRKVSDYLALLIVGPFLLLASLSVATTLQSSTVLHKLALVGEALPFLLKLVPFLSIWLAFTCAYLIMPNRRVPLVSAVLGGLVAGLLWQTAQLLYIRFQFGMAKYNAIYGAMAQLPVLLVWLYASWCIVLLGAELAFIHQLPGRGRYLQARHELWVPRFDAALTILLDVARRFERGEPPASEAEVIAELGLHPAEASRVLSRLTEVGLLTSTQEDPPGLVPALSPDRTTLTQLLDRVAALSKFEGKTPTAVARTLRKILEREYAGQSWADLALRSEPEAEE